MIGLLIGALLLGGWYLSASGQQWGLALITAGLGIAVAWQVRRQRTADQAPDDEAPSGPVSHHAPGTPASHNGR
ncbi:hypothetical protein [Corynebacterium bovis]|uniref:hypothetical protein n=1 Tax=Corynebacterium bovis TaxID=36808 RepID=UPI003138B9E5